MSFSLWVTVDHPDGYQSRFNIVDGQTYNLSPMWRKALRIGQTADLRDQQCADLRLAVLLAVEDIARNRADYEALEPPNGWGDFDGFQKVFWKFTETILAHPTGRVGWSG